MNKVTRFLSLGAGVQSSCVLYMMIDGAIEKADHAIFADTGWEPKAVYEHVEYLKPLMEAAGIKFHQVSNGNIREESMSGERTIPLFVHNKQGKVGMMDRRCTFRYKVDPLIKKQRRLVYLMPNQRYDGHLATTIFGISAEESRRMRDAAYPWMKHEYPLVDMKMTRADCIAYAKEHGYNVPPRSACIGCAYKSTAAWVQMREESPDDWQDVVEFDRALRAEARPKNLIADVFLHRSGIPIEDVVFPDSGSADDRSHFDEDCSGSCGV